MRKSSRTVAYIGILTAFAMVLSYLEFLLPPIYTAVPGIKMGLANLIIIYTLWRFGLGCAFLVSFIRVALSALLFGNTMTLLYSAAGAVLSLGIMYLLKRSRLFSVVGVSVAGAVSHNLGQILVAILVLKTLKLGYYMIVLTVTGAIAGVFVGIVAALVIKKVKL